MSKFTRTNTKGRISHLCFHAIFLAAALLGVAVDVKAAVQTWTGAGDGKTFSSPANWSPAGTPGASSDCVIPAGAAVVEVKSVISINSLSTARNMSISSCASVTLKSGLQLSAGASVSFDANGGCPAFIFDGGNQSISGSGSVNISSVGNWSIALRPINSAALTIDAGVTINYEAGPNGGGIAFLTDSGVSIINYGSILLRQPNTTYTITSGSFINHGQVECGTGALLQLASVSWSNLGVVHMRGGTFSLSGTYSSIGSTTYESGSIILKGTMSDIDLVASNDTGNITLDGITANSSRLASQDGKSFLLLNTGYLNSCSLDTQLRVSGCALVRVTGGLELVNGAGITVARDCASDVGLIFESGSHAITGDGFLAGKIRLSESTSLTLNPGVSLRAGVGSPATTLYGYSSSTLLSRGTISASGSGSVLQIGIGAFRNEGTVECTQNAEIKLIGSSWENANNITIDHAKLTVAGAWTNLGTITGIAAQLGGTSAACTNEGAISFSQASIASIFGSPFINNASILADNSTLNVGDGVASWQNPGSIAISGSILNLAGTYSALGSIARSGGSLSLGGVYSGALLAATAATGDLELKSFSTTNTTLAASGGARMVATTGVTLTGCTLLGDLFLACGSQPIIKNGITLAGTTVRTTPGCSSGMLQFQGGTQSISGVGVLEFNSSGSLSVTNSGNLTIESTIALVAASGSSAVATLSADANSTLTNHGRIVTSNAGGLFEISGPVTNLGIVETLAGETRFLNLLSSLTPLTMSSSTTVDVRAGTYTLSASVVVPAGALLALNGSYSINAPITVKSGARLSLNGTYSINAPITSEPGGKLTFQGSWTNNSTIDATNSTVSFDGTWSNPGAISVDHSSLTIGGTYSSLGDFDSNANALTYSGTFPGQSLTANASTGDITLANVKFVGATLRVADGAIFKFTNNALVILDACTLECDLFLDPCATLRIMNGLTMVDGATITNSSNIPCKSLLEFYGANQAVTGRGKIIANTNFPDLAINFVQNTTTFDPGISLIFPSATNPAEQRINLPTGASFINKGLVSMEVPGRKLTISGGTFTNLGTLRSAAGTVLISSELGNCPRPYTTFSGGTWIADGGSLTFGSRLFSTIAAGTEFFFRGQTITIPDLRTLKLNAGKLTIIDKSVTLTHAAVDGFTNSGELTLGKGGLFTVQGPLKLLPGSSLHVELGGAALTDIGRIVASFPATLSGSLTATFLAPYMPSVGDVFSPVVQATSFSGEFASVCADANPQNLGLLAQIGPSGPPYALSLIVSDESGTAPVITAQPLNTLADPDAQFVVSVSPQDASFAWRKDGEPLIDGTTAWGSLISGSTTSHLSIQGATGADVGLYDVSVSNSCASVTSTPARLSVCPADLNFDGLVDDADFSIFIIAYNILDCADSVMPAGCPADLNSDDLVDDADFSIFVIAYDAFLCP